MKLEVRRMGAGAGSVRLNAGLVASGVESIKFKVD
jgi:hypothetical protein